MVDMVISMGFDYSFKINIQRNSNTTKKFICCLKNYFDKEKLYFNNTFSDKLKCKFSISTHNNMYSLHIGEIDNITHDFIYEDYRLSVNTGLTFRPYGGTGSNGIRNMFQLIILLLMNFKGDCLLMPNGDYVALLRRNNELFIDKSRSIFSDFDFSLIDIPYTDTILDDNFFK